MSEEGYIKFKCSLVQSEPVAFEKIEKLDEWRDKLYSLGLIGAYETGVGFGNISERINDGDNFIITGSGTGNFKELSEKHYTVVTSFDFKNNSLTCKGLIKASSESLTHAAVYKSNPGINAVIHIHNIELWERLFNKVPTTSDKVEYGTPEMAEEILKLFRTENLMSECVIVMGGHKEGILSFGESLDEAGKAIMKMF